MDEIVIEPKIKVSSKTSASGVTKVVPPPKALSLRGKKWMIFVDAYLKSIEVQIDWLKSGNFDEDHQKVLLALVYNFKHVLEIIVKTYNRVYNEKFDKNDYTHNLSDLVKKLKNDKNIKSKKDVLETISKFEPIAKKYYSLEMFTAYLDGCLKFSDVDNTFFRYPEHGVMVEIDYARFI